MKRKGTWRNRFRFRPPRGFDNIRFHPIRYTTSPGTTVVCCGFLKSETNEKIISFLCVSTLVASSARGDDDLKELFRYVEPLRSRSSSRSRIWSNTVPEVSDNRICGADPS